MRYVMFFIVLLSGYLFLISCDDDPNLSPNLKSDLICAEYTPGTAINPCNPEERIVLGGYYQLEGLENRRNDGCVTKISVIHAPPDVNCAPSLEGIEYHRDTLEELEIIRIDSLNTLSFAPLADFDQLRRVTIVGFGRLSTIDLSPLTSCDNLDVIQIEAQEGLITGVQEIILPSSPSLDTLYVINQWNLQQMDLTPLQDCPTLENVQIIGNASLQSFDLSPLNNHPSLKYLTFVDSSVPELQFYTFPAMEKLIISNHLGVENLDLEPLAGSPLLIDLYLEGMRFSGIDLDPLTVLTNLESFTLSECPINDLTVPSITVTTMTLRSLYPIGSLTITEDMPNLTTLSVSLGDDEHVADATLNFGGDAPNLQTLSVGSLQSLSVFADLWIPEGWRTRIKSLSVSAIENMSGFGFLSAGLDSLQSVSLSSFGNSTEIYLNWLGVTPLLQSIDISGMSELDDCIISDPGLDTVWVQTFSLTGCAQVTRKLDDIAEAATANYPNLQTLTLSANYISPAQAEFQGVDPSEDTVILADFDFDDILAPTTPPFIFDLSYNQARGGDTEEWYYAGDFGPFCNDPLLRKRVLDLRGSVLSEEDCRNIGILTAGCPDLWFYTDCEE